MLFAIPCFGNSTQKMRHAEILEHDLIVPTKRNTGGPVCTLPLQLVRSKELQSLLSELGVQMLTIRYPQVMPKVYRLPIGLLPLFFGNDDNRPKLVIKAPKEAILAAKLNRGFKIYVAPILLQHKRTIGLVTAFF